MMPERSEPLRKIYGLAFSGAANAGKKIWIASGVVENGVLLIEDCSRGGRLLEEGTGRDPSVS
jgi:hypothetical protein